MDPLTSPNLNGVAATAANTPDIKDAKPKIRRKAVKTFSSNSSSLFHTPPPADPARQSWLTENAEQESYGTSSVTRPNPVSSNTNSMTTSPTLQEEAENDIQPVPSLETKDADAPSSSPSLGPVSLTNSSSMAAEKAASGLPAVLSQNIDKFVSSLKTPHYRSPLQPSTVSLLYQTFYDEFNSKADEYLTQSTLNHGFLASPESGSQNSNNNTATSNTTNNGSTSNSSNTQSGSNGSQPSDSSIQSFTNGFNFRGAKREIRMETYEEIAEKRRERALRPIRLREYNEIAEARATSLIYDRLFQPKIGNDIPRNEELALRIEALRSLPLSPELLDCGIVVVTDELYEKEQSESEDKSKDAPKQKKSKKPVIPESFFNSILQPVADKFAEMEQQHTPFGKLEAFLEGHQMIVDNVISAIYPDSSSSSICLAPPNARPGTPDSAEYSQNSSSTRSRARSNSGIGSNFLKRTSPAILPTSASSNSLSSQSVTSSATQPASIQRSSSQPRRQNGSDASQHSLQNPHLQKRKTSVISAVAADQILPLLIYTFVHFDIPNLWLQLAFIMRYRNQTITALGEIAYPLTNWQAAIAFIEKTSLESLGLGEQYKDLIDHVKKEQAKEKQPNNNNDDDLLIEEDPITKLVGISSYTTDYDTFTDLPSTIPLTQHNSIRAHLRHSRIAQIANSSPFNLHSINRVNNGNGSKAADGQSSGVSENAPLGGGPFATMMASTDNRRASLISPNDLVLSADQSIKSLGTTFGNNFRILMNKINAPKDQNQHEFGAHGNQEAESNGNGTGLISSAFNNALMSTKTRNPSHNGLHINSDGDSTNNTSPMLAGRRSSSSSVSSSQSNMLGTGTTLPSFNAANSVNGNVSSSAASTHSSSSSLSDSTTNLPEAIHPGPLLNRIVRSFRSNNDFKNSAHSQNSQQMTVGGIATPNGHYSALGSELVDFPSNTPEPSITVALATPPSSEDNTATTTPYYSSSSTAISTSTDKSSDREINPASAAIGSPTFPNFSSLASLTGPKLPAPSNPKLATKEWTSLTVKEIETMHYEYVRMVQFLKDNNAFC